MNAMAWQQVKDTMLVEASQPLATHSPCYTLTEVLAQQHDESDDYWERRLDYRD